MAEAHEAVAFSFKVTEEGVDINFNKEALRALYFVAKKSFKRQLARIKNSMINRVYPLQFSSWPILTLIICIAIHIGYDFSQYGMTALEDFSFKTLNIRTYTRLVAIILFSLIMWLIGVMLVRYTLWGLFSYMSWMYEPRGTMRLRTKIWMAAIKFLKSKEARLYGYQNSLPKLPVPKIDDTISRYLLSVRPLLDDENYEEMVRLADDFKKTISFKLQCFLHIKSFLTSNYISDWWEEYIYLHGRNPIMVNSNFYCLDFIDSHVSGSQLAKAANITYLILQHRRSIDRENMKPIYINSVIPLCSSQYERQFNTSRIPGESKDNLIHYKNSQHIVVMHSGKYFKVQVQNDKGILRPVDIEKSLQYIVNNKEIPTEGERKLAALTAGERIPWAKARKDYFSHGVNKTSLDAIDKAAFVLVLDDVDYLENPHDASSLRDFAKAGLTGDCTNRWFDKSFNLYIGKNGVMGLNVEHSWADAPVTSQMWEVICGKNYLATLNSDGIVGYTPQLHCVGTPDDSYPPPKRLIWNIPDPCLQVIQQSFETATKLAEDTDVFVLHHKKFGKGAMKLLNVSPDSFIQIGLQLTYYRLMGKFCLTYEASMTRMFRDGRTETVRSCTIESCNFVRAFIDESVSVKEKIYLFQKASERHQDLYRDAMSGKGVDRHLFSLYVVSKYLGVKSPFLQKVLNEPWFLSTSQTPHTQCNILDVKKYPLKISAGGGFGPVADDGYGVSYVIAGEDNIFFHISSKKSCSVTNSEKMAMHIEQALSDLKLLLETKC